MSDLTELNSTLPVKIAGASSSGSETTFVNATLNGEIKSADFINVTVTQGTLNVAVSTPVEIKAGASRLVNRKSIQIQAQGTNLSYGFSSGSQPFTIANGTTIVISVGDAVGVWVTRTSGIGTAPLAYAEFA